MVASDERYDRFNKYTISYWLSVPIEDNVKYERCKGSFSTHTNLIFKVWVTLSLSVKELNNFKVAIL